MADMNDALQAQLQVMFDCVNALFSGVLHNVVGMRLLDDACRCLRRITLFGRNA